MKSIVLVLAFASCILADGLHGHARRAGRAGRRPQSRSFRRGGRQEDAAGSYLAPAEETTLLPEYEDYEYPEEAVETYAGGDLATEASTAEEELAGVDPLAMLQTAIPGVPGEDYPIFAEVPESGFSCEGQVDGGYYADPEAECQVFHICTADGQGGLSKYSFLCPNGTIFNQNYFICDWWFNFDCAEAEGLYSLNDDIAAEREAATAAGAEGAADESVASYAAPVETPVYDDYPAEIPAYEEEVPAYEEYPEYPEEVVTEAATEAPVYDDVIYDDAALPGYAAEEETTLAPLDDSYLSPAEEARRRGRNGQRGGRQGAGRRGGRKQGGSRRGGRRQGRRGQNQRRPSSQGRRSFRG